MKKCFHQVLKPDCRKHRQRRLQRQPRKYIDPNQNEQEERQTGSTHKPIKSQCSSASYSGAIEVVNWIELRLP